MAGQSLTADHAKHFTTTGGAGNADTLTLASAVAAVWVTNNDSAVLLYVRLDGTNPVAGADETYVVPPKTSKRLAGPSGVPFTVVKVISASAISVDVEDGS